jgi:uncharacterized membrane protein YeaQ/YmgE (transglycosylase-associated protein family)
MGPYVWCVIGVVFGWLSGFAGPAPSVVERIEAVAVGAFGAFLGGEFLPQMVLQKQAIGTGLNAATVSMSIGGAVIALILLRWMKHAVGPMKPSKKKERKVV